VLLALPRVLVDSCSDDMGRDLVIDKGMDQRQELSNITLPTQKCPRYTRIKKCLSRLQNGIIKLIFVLWDSVEVNWDEIVLKGGFFDATFTTFG